MTVLHLMLDGALAAAEMLALLFVSPATAAEPATIDVQGVEERPIQVHRLTTAVDVRLLGALADVRVTQIVRDDGPTTADPGSPLPAAGHARLTEDEAIADAMQFARGASAVFEDAAGYRVVLPLSVEADAPHIAFVDQGDIVFLLVVPHRRASAATLVLRPASGASTVLHLGAVNSGLALLVPLANRGQLEDLAHGAIELELADGNASYWATVVADRVDERAVQARTPE